MEPSRPEEHGLPFNWQKLDHRYGCIGFDQIGRSELFDPCDDYSASPKD